MKPSNCKKQGCFSCIKITEGHILVVILVIAIFMISNVRCFKHMEARDIYHAEYDSLFAQNSKEILEQLNRLNDITPINNLVSGEKDNQLKRFIQKKDSILSYVVANQLTIMKRQDDLINDIRQETNNNLDKINSMLTFWIGMLSLLGIFIPIALQFKLVNSSKYELERIRSESDSLQVKLDRMNERISFINNLNAIQNAILNKTFAETINEPVISCLWKDSIKKFDLMISTVFEEDNCNKALKVDIERYNELLINPLIFLHSTLILFNTRVFKSRHRIITNSCDKINVLIDKVSNKAYESHDILHDELKKIIIELSKITYSTSKYNNRAS